MTIHRRPPDGAALLDDLRATVRKYVALPSPEALDAVTLWIAATHALAAFQHAPRLVIKSPEKRCGKSRLLDVIAGTCHNPLLSINATVPAIFRSIGDAEDHPPTLLIDEADALWATRRAAEQNEDLRALVNAGHQRGRPALRCVGPQQVPTEFATFTMAALAGIGDLPDTITDRAVNVTMRRRAVDEQVSSFRERRDGPDLTKLRDRLAAWGAAVLGDLEKAEPDMPVDDRAADTWEPLVAVADRAGGDWPKRSRKACRVLVAQAAESDQDGSANLRLLTDIRHIFGEQSKLTPTPFLSSRQLVDALRKIDEAPWREFDLTPRGLAQRLQPFGIKPRRDTTGDARGYRIEELTDAFGRYLRQNASESVNTGSEQGKRSDTAEASDASTCQMGSICQTETAGRTANLTHLTGSDDPPAQTVLSGPTGHLFEWGPPPIDLETGVTDEELRKAPSEHRRTWR